MLQTYSTLIYGFLIFMGGFMGYSKAGSKPSLIAGTLCGSLLLLATLLFYKQNAYAQPLAMIVASLIFFIFIKRLIVAFKTGKGIVRAIGILALSLAEIVILLK